MRRNSRLGIKGTLIAALLFSTQSHAADNVVFTGALIAVPCTVNGVMEVLFGDDVVTTKVNGVSYKRKAIPMDKIDCSNRRFDEMKMTILGNYVGPGNVLVTDKDNLGIVLFAGSSTDPLFLNVVYDFNYPLPKLEAALIKLTSSRKLTGGKFSASATLLLEYR